MARVPECQKSKLMGYTSMALNAWNSNNLEQLALKGLMSLGHLTKWQKTLFSAEVAGVRCTRMRGQSVD